MAKSTASGRSGKGSTAVRTTAKDFPLTRHPRGYCCKQVCGKLSDFGKIDGDEVGHAALNLWLDQKDD